MFFSEGDIFTLDHNGESKTVKITGVDEGQINVETINNKKKKSKEKLFINFPTPDSNINQRILNDLDNSSLINLFQINLTMRNLKDSKLFWLSRFRYKYGSHIPFEYKTSGETYLEFERFFLEPFDLSFEHYLNILETNDLSLLKYFLNQPGEDFKLSPDDARRLIDDSEIPFDCFIYLISRDFEFSQENIDLINFLAFECGRFDIIQKLIQYKCKMSYEGINNDFKSFLNNHSLKSVSTQCTLKNRLFFGYKPNQKIINKFYLEDWRQADLIFGLYNCKPSKKTLKKIPLPGKVILARKYY